MPVGAPRSKKFQIGTAELRVAPMASALKLLQSHSVGLVDSTGVTIAQESVDLEGGFPKTLFDSAIIRQTAEVTAVMREYSRRNLRMLIGEGVGGTPAVDAASTVATAASSGATSLALATGGGAGFTAGALAVHYTAGQPENVQLLRVASIATDTLTLDADTPLLFDAAVGDPVFVAHQIAIGAVTQTNYMSAMVLQKENSTGRPISWNFWKVSITGNLDYQTNSDDFSSTTTTLKCLQPAAEEYASGAALEHLAAIIPTHPTGLFAMGA